MNLILFDDHGRNNLLPLTFTRPVAELRVGILTIREKWEKLFDLPASYLTQEYLQEKYSYRITDDNLVLNGAVLPDGNLFRKVRELKAGEALKQGERLIAARTGEASFNLDDSLLHDRAKTYQGTISVIDYPWKIFLLNAQEIISDFKLITSGRPSAKLSKTVQVIPGGEIFVEEGFKGEFITLNTSTGPIYLGSDSEIMEGSSIRGPFALCEGSTVKMGAKIYGATTIGPYSKAGGEINNSVIYGRSNKGHDGFLGNSVIGEWCNLGADTNNSNLKNNYAEVKVWNYPENRFIGTGLQFCGLIMGDHSKSAINTMFNTGTVVGVSANVFGSGFPKNFIPSFSWGGVARTLVYQIEKAFETMQFVMDRREEKLTEKEKDIYIQIFNETAKYRKHF